MRVKCPAQEHNTMHFTQPGLEPGPQIVTNSMLGEGGGGNTAMDHVASHPEELKYF